MVNIENLIARDLNHVWHPCSQMKNFKEHPPLIIERAKGSYLYTNKGPLIDAISSWWCKSLGHGHLAILQALQEQLSRFEHVIAANTTHPTMVLLAEKLSQLTKKQHCFFASDGSSAVEIAMKLALHAKRIQGNSHKNQFIALKNGYHGETLATLNISDLGLYKEPYTYMQTSCHFINPMPYRDGPKDCLWQNAEEEWRLIEKELELKKDTVCAIIFEPIVQGAAGMQIYSPDLLKRLAKWAKKNNIYLIADEIMTGLGRTGKWLACEHAEISPDFICLSKGLTSGSVPLSCVMVDHTIFELFDDSSPNKSFLHSHTYSANALALSAALATLTAMEEEQIIEKTKDLSDLMQKYFQEVASLSGRLTSVRGIGGLVAAEFETSNKLSINKKITQIAERKGALLRPIGNTLYWLPPLNTSKEIIGKLAEITLHSIKEAYL